MTHAAPRKRGGKTWLLPTVAVVAIAVAVGFDFMSRSIALDALSWWPVWLALGGLGFWGRQVRVGPLRLPGLIGISTAIAVTLLALAHIQGWAFLPSAASRLEGSGDGDVVSAALSARVPEGQVDVSSGAGRVLYEVEPIRRGGPIAMAASVERAQDGTVSIELSQQEDPGLFLWSGWHLSLSTMPIWALTLEGMVDADLSDLQVENVQVIGSGHIVLGQVSRSTPVTVGGDFVIEVPEGVAVRVIGAAQIPDDWERTETGANSPIAGHGWVISVSDGAIVRITTA